MSKETLMSRRRKNRKCTLLNMLKENQKLYTDDSMVCHKKTVVDTVFTLKTAPSTISLTNSIMK